MTHGLAGRIVAFLVANEGVEQVELTEPWQAVEEAGGRVRFVAAMVGGGKPVAAICHAPWTLAEADVVRGRRLTARTS